MKRLFIIIAISLCIVGCDRPYDHITKTMDPLGDEAALVGRWKNCNKKHAVQQLVFTGEQFFSQDIRNRKLYPQSYEVTGKNEFIALGYLNRGAYKGPWMYEGKIQDVYKFTYSVGFDGKNLILTVKAKKNAVGKVYDGIDGKYYRRARVREFSKGGRLNP